MNKSNLYLLLLTGSNFFVIWCVALLNSLFNPWGIFVYLPGLLIIPQYQLLDSYRGVVSLLLSGFLWDHFFNHTLGFHAFLFGLIFLISREFIRSGKQNPKFIILYQQTTNFILAVLWFLLCGLDNPENGNWYLSRLMSDILISALLLIPISYWYIKFCNELVYRFEPSLRRIITPSK